MLKVNRIGVVMTVLVVAGMIAVSAGPASAIYKDTVLADGPVAYYTLDEAGSTAINYGSTGPGGDGTYIGTPTQAVAGAVGGAVSLDGDDVVRAPQAAIGTLSAKWVCT